jgi:hypothetical protein
MVRITSVEGVAYLAGFFDGEGCIGIYRSGKTGQMVLRVNLVNTNDIVIRIIQSIYGGCISIQQHQSNWKPAYSWCASGRQAREFLKDVGPYLVMKRPQFEVAFRFFNTFDLPNSKKFDYKKRKIGAYAVIKDDVVVERSACKESLHLLNKKGVVV